jgi:hypothetical protein
VVSLGVLCDLVRELRVAKYKAEKQVKYKALIDRMKAIRSDIGVDRDISAMCEREATRNTGPEGYFFRNKKEAKAELQRMNNIVDLDISARGIDRRHAASIACPLGHGMSRLRDFVDKPIKEVVVKKKKKVIPQSNELSVTEAFNSCFEDINDEADEIGENKSEDEGQKDGEPKEKVYTEMGMTGEVPVQYRETSYDCSCRVCDKNCRDGYTCAMCEYDLCSECSVVYCRQGHVMQIWTLPEANGISCEMCSRSKMTMGYRCMDCSIDICDRCTCQEPRQGMKIWPKREIKKLMSFMDSVKSDSECAMLLYQRAVEYSEKEQDEGLSMSAICKMLTDLRDGKVIAMEEIIVRKKKVEALKYALHSTDF